MNVHAKFEKNCDGIDGFHIEKLDFCSYYQVNQNKCLKFMKLE